ncbi:acyltransferase [Mycolicibacterium aromaticivorans JS19b1 = JCM 16368]|uniref:Acyltransferase n=1 Tax=Mycolicibacterium aromaticivorans JS19b1 = JCM 16368 TaxID=1440774 RepID=A0A064CSM5_9MYCO|nr:acyltransferase [Mycolicibacterium aromaticivorans]KDF01788.1 acyltransferase [Mycolicibacterium aromaticivorans JS19b1 = JCM 16368]
MLAGPNLDQRSGPSQPVRGRPASLTGLRALAALLVVGTHAAFATGMLSHGYLGLMSARMEIGVSIFFALSGFLLFRPWVTAAAAGTGAPSTRAYAQRRLRRVMPAYVVTVLLAYGVFAFYSTGPNPGQSWSGLIRHLTLTQIYTNNYLLTSLHRGLSQTWSLAVEAAFYAVLPLLVHLLLVVLCGDRWRPGRLLAGLAALAAISPVWLIVLNSTDWLPNSAGMWLPAQLAAFAGGMAVAVLQTTGVRWRAGLVIPAAVLLYLLVSTPLAGAVTRALLYAVIAMLVVAAPTLAAGGLFDRLLASGPMVWLGEISYEIFLLHVLVMAILFGAVLGWPLFTGSLPGLYLLTLGATVPLAWLLHRLTGVATCRCLGSRRTRCPSRWDVPSCSRRTMRRRPRSCSSTHTPVGP